MMFGISKRRFQIVFIAFVALSTVRLCVAELFTAISDMEELLESEAVLINNLEAYVATQENKLNYLKRQISSYQREHDEASKDFSKYISNPINAYLLTKRLTSDWKVVEQEMSRDVSSEFLENVTMHRNIMKFPSYEDLNGAAQALIRLQTTYKLDTASVARGELNGVKYSTQMSSNDCFEMGRQSHLNENYYHTSLWMKEAMARWNNNSNEITSIPKADILDYLAYSMFKQGNIQSALELTNELLELAPDDEKANGNKQFYDLPELDAESINKAAASGIYTSYERQMYEKLCRGEIGPEPKLFAKLKCRYVTNKSPFLKIAPLKLEEASLKPYIVVYHDVISDAEIELIKQMAKPRFKRAVVENPGGKLEIATYRISKSAWLKDEKHEVLPVLGKRVEDMTGLTVNTAEELQVVNYGIGGHYVPHFDFAWKEEMKEFDRDGTGNRIATVFFYGSMSDVPQGGATVFPYIKVAVQPRKGSAVIWHNLHASGEGDYLTRHAACPVLTGSKWVSNRWIHERGQEFLRPCELKPDHPNIDY